MMWYFSLYVIGMCFLHNFTLGLFEVIQSERKEKVGKEEGRQEGMLALLRNFKCIYLLLPERALLILFKPHKHIRAHMHVHT